MMKKISAACAAAALSVGIAGNAQALEPVNPQPAVPLTYSNPAYAKVAPAEAKKMIEAGVTVVDVREPDEFASGHIQGSVNVLDLHARHAPQGDSERRRQGPRDLPLGRSR